MKSQSVLMACDKVGIVTSDQTCFGMKIIIDNSRGQLALYLSNTFESPPCTIASPQQTSLFFPLPLQIMMPVIRSSYQFSGASRVNHSDFVTSEKMA